jgi:ketosteroid isomerase-like protein
VSEENVEIARRGFDAVFRRPKPDFATINDLFHPNHEFVSTTSGVEGRTFQGASGFREWLTNMGEAWKSWVNELEQVTNIDKDRVLAITSFRSRGKASGVALEQRVASIVTVRGGKIVRTENYPSADEARKAAGLEG